MPGFFPVGVLDAIIDRLDDRTGQLKTGEVVEASLGAQGR